MTITHVDGCAAWVNGIEGLDFKLDGNILNKTEHTVIHGVMRTHIVHTV